MTTFSGNCPRAVSSVGKYHLRQIRGLWSIQLDYATSDEMVRATSLGHQALVDLITQGRLREGGGPVGGAFYINEYEQVLLPGRGGSPCSLAGEYQRVLEFDIEGTTVSASGLGRPPQLPIAATPWPGPRQGIPYVLEFAAGRWDIHYWRQLVDGDWELERLSRYCVRARVDELSHLIRGVKRRTGRFYVNEQRQMFAPRGQQEDGWETVYVGELDLNAGWFPKPSARDR